MSVEENRALIQRFVEEVFNSGNVDVVDEIYGPVYVGHTAGLPEQTLGPEGVREFVELYRSAFPDLHTTIEDINAEGDKVACRWTAVGTHRAELLGAASFERFAGACAILTAIASFLYAVAFVILQNVVLSALFLTAVGLLSSAVLVAVYYRVRGSRTIAATHSLSSPPYEEKYEALHSLARGRV
jgi:predicted ester cyclase